MGDPIGGMGGQRGGARLLVAAAAHEGPGAGAGDQVGGGRLRMGVSHHHVLLLMGVRMG